MFSRISPYCVALAIGVTICTAAFPEGARAADIVYTDEASFLSTLLPGYYSEDFASIGNGPLGNTTLSQGLFSYVVGAQDGNGAWGNPGANPSNIQTSDAGSGLEFTMTGASVYAIGGDFYDGNGIGDYADNAAETVSLSDGTTYTFNPSSSSDFVGFISDSPITSLTLTGANQYNTSSLFIVGVAAPESNTAMLLALALPLIGGVLVLRRRKAH